MEISSNFELLKFLTEEITKMKVLLYVSSEEETENLEMISLITKQTFFSNNCILGIINDESKDAEDLFRLYNIEYVPTCLLLNSDNSVLSNYI